MSAGCEEIASPQRRWGVPRSRLMVPDDISRVFGGTVPVMHIHANNEPQIVKALVEMQAAHRKFGHGNMVSGAMNLNNMPDPVAILGRQVPEATVVTGIDMGQAANEPYFDVVPESPFRQSQAIKKPRGTLFPVAA